MRVRTGTSGFSYAEWKGHFYPADLPAAKMLAYYAERLDTVEINNTFYRMPKTALLEGWAKQVPPAFTFILKAPQRITHRARLKDCAELVSAFHQTAAVLGEQLGPVLFQLAPYTKKDLPLLADFLPLIPAGRRAAFEFRNASWNDDAVYELLRKHGAAWCVADTDEVSAPIVATASWGYMRMRREDYTDADLAAWADKVRAQSWSEAFVFFKHEDAGTGPMLATRFRQLCGG